MFPMLWNPFPAKPRAHAPRPRARQRGDLFVGLTAEPSGRPSPPRPPDDQQRLREEHHAAAFNVVVGEHALDVARQARRSSPKLLASLEQDLRNRIEKRDALTRQLGMAPNSPPAIAASVAPTQARCDLIVNTGGLMPAGCGTVAGLPARMGWWPWVLDLATLQTRQHTPIIWEHDGPSIASAAQVWAESRRTLRATGAMNASAEAGQLLASARAGRRWHCSLEAAGGSIEPVHFGQWATVNEREQRGQFLLVRGATLNAIVITNQPGDPRTSATFQP